MKLMRQLECDFIVEEQLAHARLHFASERALALPTPEACSEVLAAAYTMLNTMETWWRRGTNQLWHRRRRVGPDGALVHAALGHARAHRFAATHDFSPEVEEALRVLETTGAVIGAGAPAGHPRRP
jgi:hypothetical protein